MAPVSHTLEADLRAAREAAKLTIEDIHQETRLATDILKRFESGQLIGDPSFNAVYLKAFARSYGEAVGIRPHKVDAAMEAVKAGTYRGELHPDYVDGSVKAAEDEQSTSKDDASATGETVKPQKASQFPKVDPLPAAIPTGSTAFEGPTPVPYSGARPTRRLQKNVRATSGGSFDTAWGAILGVTVLVVLAVCTILWLLFRSDSPEPDVATTAGADTALTALGDSSISGSSTGQSGAPRLTFPVEVTVVAGGDGLQSFRVTEVPAERRPVWVEPGESVTFSSNRSVVLWGEGGLGMNPNEVTLRFRGYEWNPPPGQILRIDSTYGQTLLDSLHTVFPAGGRPTPQS